MLIDDDVALFVAHDAVAVQAVAELETGLATCAKLSVKSSAD